MAVMRAATANATSGADFTPGWDSMRRPIASRSEPGMSRRKTLGMPGGALPRIWRTSDCSTRKTASVNMTPTPSATTAACDWLPGR